ncbi:hypothetical protein [Bradyrhizobium sp. 141]|uniref:hypothetical protein n=1 Tax=Bradyrhizobium sp. 141 TaxID=2782617 RepID=UPI001FF897CD|nr:hypothetical protein [Bradyrhizobium sp. 141]MCK1723033.1 hypothetical protein [Bradyrhizobium sp. 141]
MQKKILRENIASRFTQPPCRRSLCDGPMVAQDVGRRIEIGDYRVTLAGLERIAQLRFAPSLHEAAAL